MTDNYTLEQNVNGILIFNGLDPVHMLGAPNL